METAKITIDKIYENEAPAPSKIIDTVGGEWKVFKDVFDQLNFKRQATYEVKYKDGKPFKGKIDKIIQSAVAQAAESQPTTNGRAAPQSNRDAIIAALALYKPFGNTGQVPLDKQSIKAALLKCYEAYNEFLAEIGQ